MVSKRAPIGYVARLKRESAFNQGCLAVVPDPAVLRSDFLTWALSVRGNELNVLGRGTTFMELSAGDLASAVFQLPSLDQQRAIADYLDRETAKIDALIEQQERLIATLRERSSAFREHQLLSRTAARKTTARRAFTKVSRPAVSGLEVITAYRDGRVTHRSNRRDDGYTMSDLEHGYQEIRPGEIVFHALDGFAGAVGVSDSHGNATPVYHVCTPTQGDDPEFLALYLRQLGTCGLLSTLAPNVRQRSVDFRNWSTFGRIPLELPEPQVQRDAVRAIKASERRIDELIQTAERFIELSRERRAALITAAVTGQIEVGAAWAAKH